MSACKEGMLRHFLAALAYRTQKALRIVADIHVENVTGDQVDPSSPDGDWPEKVS